MADRCLVVVRAGDRSLHPQWTRALATRGFDLCVSYFGRDPTRYRAAGERRIDDPGSKWHGLHALLTRDSFWRGYDYVWLPDDDLATDQASITRLFACMRRYALDLAQPALSWQSFYSHDVTVRHPSFALRRTDFVEIMAPCFARAVLEACLPTFVENLCGWGLDRLWPGLRPDEPPRCGIVDAVEITHTRAVGGPGYEPLRAAGLTPQMEYEALLRRHHLPRELNPRVLGAVEASGRTLDAAAPAEAARLRNHLAADWRAFQAARRGWDPLRIGVHARFAHRMPPRGP